MAESPDSELERWLDQLSAGDLRCRPDEQLIRDPKIARLASSLATLQARWLEERETSATQTLARIADETAAFEREGRIFDVHVDGIVILNSAWEVTRANKAFLAMSGRSPGETTGAAFARLLVRPEVVDQTLAPDLEQEGAIRDVVLALARPDGGRVTVSVSGSSIRRSRDSVEVVLIARDMRETERRLAAEAAAEAERRRSLELQNTLEKLELAHRELASSRERLLHADRLAAIGQMAAGVVHEINNPAAFVLANLDLVNERLDAVTHQLRTQGAAGEDLLALLEEARSLTEDNSRGVARICSIVRDLKTFSRIENADIDLLDLNELVRVATRMVQNELRHRGRLVLDLAELPRVAADRGKIAQVLLNLMINAVQALDDGRVAENTVTVTTDVIGDRVRVSVEDTGHGIPDGVRERIFEPFFTTKPREAGTGLGLSLSAEIIAAHRGEIHVSSVAGAGARFEIILPKDTGLTITSQPPPALVPDLVSPGGRVLIIDDEPGLCRALQRLLDPPYEVVYATGGRAAITLLDQDQDFDAVLCDLMMPDVNGPGVYEHILRVAPRLAPRTVFCTGGVFADPVRTFLQTSGRPCLEKPIERASLMAAVQRVVSAATIEDIA